MLQEALKTKKIQHASARIEANAVIEVTKTLEIQLKET